MRILYDNKIDDLAASRITALTANPLYAATNVIDERLTTQWWSTAATSQTMIFNAGSDAIVGGNIGLVTGSAATNLVTDPEDYTTANWTKTNAVVTTAGTVLGMQLNKVTQTTAATNVISAADIGFTETTGTVMAIIRKGDVATASFRIRDIDDSDATRAQATVTFATKAITYNTGTEAVPAEWIDDDTVRVFIKTSGLVPANDNRFQYNPIGTDTEFMYCTAALAIDNTYPVPYVATSRSAISTSYSEPLPPSGKFIVDCEFEPYFAYDTGSDQNLFGWYVSSGKFFRGAYLASTDKFGVRWNDGGTERGITSVQYDDGSSYRNVNDRIRLTVSIDLSTGDTTGSKLYMNGVLDSSSWTGNIDSLSTAFPTMEVGLHNGGGFFNGIFRHAKVYGGNLTESITTEAELDAALTKRKLLVDKSYQSQFDFDTVAVMGHNISEGAAVKMEANNWNEWNYTDGSGSSIIQEALTWDATTILKMRTASKKQYVKFTINDPGNSDGVIKVGRFWIGRYLDISPSSLDDFSIIKKRSDRVQYGRNRQKFADKGTGWRQFDLRFPRTGVTMVTAIQTMYDEVGNHGSVIFCNFDTIRDYKIVEPCYCSIVGEISFTHYGRQKYSYGLTLEENK